MKKNTLTLMAAFAILATASLQAQITVLIGWDDAPDTGDNVPVVDYAQNHQYVSGITGLINDGRQAVTFQGSTDGTYGPLAGPPNPTAATGRFEIQQRSNALDTRITISISNNTGTAYALDALVFDFSRQFNGSPDAFVVNYMGDLSSSSLGDVGFSQTILTVTGLAVTGANDDLPDYSASISSELADNVLGNGETAVFRIITTNASSTAAGIIDNIAFTGQAVPEPSTFAFLGGLAALGLVFYRRAGR